MLENKPPEPFSSVILCRYVMKLLTEKPNVLTKKFHSPLKIVFLPDTKIKPFENKLFCSLP